MEPRALHLHVVLAELRVPCEALTTHGARWMVQTSQAFEAYPIAGRVRRSQQPVLVAVHGAVRFVSGALQS